MGLNTGMVSIISALNLKMFFLKYDSRKNENVSEMPKSHFKDVKKVADFPYVRGEGGSTNILKIPYVFCR